MLISQSYRQGIRHTSGIITLALATTPQTIWTLSGQSLAPTALRTAVIRKIMLQNTGGVATAVTFGTGTAPFVPQIPGFNVLNGADAQFPEDLINNFEFFANITVQMSVATVSCLVQIEVEEYEGGSAHG